MIRVILAEFSDPNQARIAKSFLESCRYRESDIIVTDYGVLIVDIRQEFLFQLSRDFQRFIKEPLKFTSQKITNFEVHTFNIEKDTVL